MENEALLVSACRRGPHDPPETQRFMADRMRASIRSYRVDHSPMLSAPDLVVDVILDAVRETLST